MSSDRILALLIAERDKLTKAIEALEGPKRRGRPPKYGIPAIYIAKRRGRPPKFAPDADPQKVAEKQKTRRKFSAASRRKMAAAQKKRWAAIKAAE